MCNVPARERLIELSIEKVSQQTSMKIQVDQTRLCTILVNLTQRVIKIAKYGSTITFGLKIIKPQTNQVMVQIQLCVNDDNNSNELRDRTHDNSLDQSHNEKEHEEQIEKCSQIAKQLQGNVQINNRGSQGKFYIMFFTAATSTAPKIERLTSKSNAGEEGGALPNNPLAMMNLQNMSQNTGNTSKDSSFQMWMEEVEQQPRILMCDDEPQVLEALKIMVEDEGLESCTEFFIKGKPLVKRVRDLLVRCVE